MATQSVGMETPEVTDGNWGAAGDTPLQSPQQDNQAGRHDNQPSSRAYAGVNAQPKFGFEAYMQHRINQSGSLWGRKGAPAAYSEGPYKGMEPGQAQEAARAEYDALPDDQRKNWENTANGGDIRSGREMASAQGQQMPQPPYTAPGSNPTPAAAELTDGNWGKSGNNPLSAPAPSAVTPATAPTPAVAPTPPISPAPAAAPGPVVQPPPGQGPPPALSINPAVQAEQPFSAPTRPAMAYPGATANTQQFGPALGGGGANPVTTNATSPMGPGEPASSLPTANLNASAAASGPVGAVNPASGMADASGAKATTMPPYAPKMAGADEDVDPATGKKRTPAMA